MDQEPTYFRCGNCNYEIEDISKYDYEWEDMFYFSFLITHFLHYIFDIQIAL